MGDVVFKEGVLRDLLVLLVLKKWEELFSLARDESEENLAGFWWRGL